MAAFSVIYFFMLIPLLAQSSWLPWEQWGDCSRSCGTGTMHKYRTCDTSDGKPCRGRRAMYRLCNTQPCRDHSEDFRALQCRLHSPGRGPQWEPVFHYADRCALVCQRAGGGGPVKLAPRVIDGTNCTTPSSKFFKVCVEGKCRRVGCNGIVGSSKTVDRCGVCGGKGRSCTQSKLQKEILEEGILPVKSSGVVITQRPPRGDIQEDILDYQTPGKADRGHEATTLLPLDLEEIDTDTKQEPNAQGANQTSREQPPGDSYNPYDQLLHETSDELGRPVAIPLHLWYETPYGDCSVSCGVGERRTSIVCRSVKTREQVEESSCLIPKPPHRATVCEMLPCQVRWITSDYSACSVSCGGGSQSRDVICVEVLTTGAYERTDPKKCTDPAPDRRKSCNPLPCPRAKWFAGQWLPCSTTCGRGVQYRPVVCKMQSVGDTCDEHTRPPDKQECHVGISCTPGESVSRKLVVMPIRTTPTPPAGREIVDLSEADQQLALEGREGLENVLERPVPGGGGLELPHSYQFDYDYRGGEVDEREDISSGEIPDTQITSDVPSFYVSDWGACSATCGIGSKTRLVQCRVLSGYSNSVLVLADSRCEGEVPERNGQCGYGECPNTDRQLQIQRYAWKHVGHEPCPVTCGGGLQAPLFQCTRFDPNVMIFVDRELCARVQLPEVLKQSCNEFDCPASLVRTEPRWRAEQWGECSQRCGPGGISRRLVECVRDIEEGREVAVDERVCGNQEKPSALRLCNAVDCPPEWVAEDWSECSASCGRGTRTRKVTCQQLKFEFNTRSRTPSAVPEVYCPTSIKPSETEACMQSRCPTAEIKEDPSHYVQLHPRKIIRIKAGGRAELIEGTRVRGRCNVRKFPQKDITWSYKGKELPPRGRVKVSKKGILQIRRLLLSDSGDYVCHVADQTIPLTIHVVTHQQARDQRMRREQLETKDRQFLLKFRNIVRTRRNRKEEYTEHFIMKHFQRYELPMKFVTSQWGQCSRSCGGAGLQRRQVTCELNLDQYALVMNDIYCVEKGYDKPLDTQDCGYMACPEWRVGDWKECSDSMCVGLGQGSRTRDLVCVDNAESEVELERCDPSTRPQASLACNMTSCSASWVTSPWTQCSITCGGDGVQTRLLDCVWAPSRRAAFNACANIPKPATMRRCSTQPCARNVCLDQSKHCELVKMLNLCRYLEYRTKCCWTCTAAALRLRQFRQ